jgi:hypothetical protein
MTNTDRAPRGSLKWSLRRIGRHEIIGRQITIAIALPLGAALISYWLAAVVAVPCWYIAVSQGLRWKQLNDAERDAES